MNARTILLFLAAFSALGIAYFVADLWIGLEAGVTGAKIFLTAIAATLAPLVAGVGSVWWFSKQAAGKAAVFKLAALQALSWAWLYAGSIYLGLLRLQ
jgi:hypothetical protein